MVVPALVPWCALCIQLTVWEVASARWLSKGMSTLDWRKQLISDNLVANVPLV
jgi:hypothetical protein